MSNTIGNLTVQPSVIFTPDSTFTLGTNGARPFMIADHAIRQEHLAESIQLLLEAAKNSANYNDTNAVFDLFAGKIKDIQDTLGTDEITLSSLVDALGRWQNSDGTPTGLIKTFQDSLSAVQDDITSLGGRIEALENAPAPTAPPQIEVNLAQQTDESWGFPVNGGTINLTKHYYIFLEGIKLKKDVHYSAVSGNLGFLTFLSPFSAQVVAGSRVEAVGEAID